MAVRYRTISPREVPLVVAKNDELTPAQISTLIDERIASYGDWRGEVLASIRALIKQALPDVVEEWKWNIPVWSHNGIICTGEVYKAAVKSTFAKGASLPDPKGLFTSSLEGKVRRAMDITEGQKIKATAFKALVKAAAKANAAKK